MTLSRRGFLTLQQQDSMSGRGATGTLRDPYSVGRPRERATEADNNEAVKNIEKRLRCSCGCNLDIFTCRTTDFTCATSPRLHRQVLALHDSGKSAEQIIQQFIDEYGEQALMAPEPKGFNLAGYLVPGSVILVAATLLAAYLLRRRAVAAAEGGPAPMVPAVPAGVNATAEELDRVRQALAKDEEL